MRSNADFRRYREKYDPVADTAYPHSIWSDIIGLENARVGNKGKREGKRERERERENEKVEEM